MTEVAAALIWDEDRFMICQRPAYKGNALLWEFVGGKWEPGETGEQALIRECKEELDITVQVGDVFFDVVHQYPDILVHLTVYNATIKEGTPKLLEHNDLRWITPDEIPQYPFCPADKDILERIVLHKGAKSIPILFEDAHIAVCLKPHGVISQSAPDGKDMVSRLQAQLDCDIYPVHRLDRETGGVMVYAKTKNAAAKLCGDVAQRKLQKTYLAIVHGTVLEQSGELRDLLFRDQKRNKSYVVKSARKGVKEAVLRFERKAATNSPFGEITLLKVALLTGRTHQIRVQFASRGYPLVGDKRYGAGNTASTMGLWSHTLAFTHPASGDLLSFTATPKNSPAFDFFEQQILE